MRESDRRKLVVVVVLLVAAAVVFAWNLGLFGGGSSAPAARPASDQPARSQPRVNPGGQK